MITLLLISSILLSYISLALLLLHLKKKCKNPISIETWRVKNLNTRQRLGFFCQSFWTLARGALSEESTVPRILVSWTESTNGCHISSIFPATLSRSSTLVPEAAVFGAKLFTLYFLLMDMLTLPEFLRRKLGLQ